MLSIHVAEKATQQWCDYIGNHCCSCNCWFLDVICFRLNSQHQIINYVHMKLNEPGTGLPWHATHSLSVEAHATQRMLDKLVIACITPHDRLCNRMQAKHKQLRTRLCKFIVREFSVLMTSYFAQRNAGRRKAREILQLCFSQKSNDFRCIHLS